MRAVLFGDRSRFAIEVGECVDGEELRRVDVWAADRWLTCDDNHVYVPAFLIKLEGTIRRLLIPDSFAPRPVPHLPFADNLRRLISDESAYHDRQIARFMDWGPTADNVIAFLFREGESAIIPFEFRREAHHDPGELDRVFVAELSVWELLQVLHDATWSVTWGWTNWLRADD